MNFDAIRDSPTNIYNDALPFSPSSSWLHEWYAAEQVVKVVKGRPEKWGTCSRVVSFDHSPGALAHKKDIVTVGLSSGDILILDAITGTSRSVLSGHTKNVISFAFSLDGALLVSGSNDNTVKLWDIQTGGVVKTFYGGAHSLCSVSISPDSATIASGTKNGAIRMWDVRTGECCRIIRHTLGSAMTCVNFLPTVPGRIMAASEGGSVQQWDIDGSRIGLETSGYHIAFSSDGSRFVLCGVGPPTVQDSISGATIATLHSHAHRFSCCCFSPSGEFVAGVADATIYVWDITRSNAPLIGTFVPHDSNISSLVYSSSLVSASSDKTVRFSQIGGSLPDQVTENTRSTIPTSAEVTRLALQAEEGIAISIDSVGMVGFWDLSTGLRKAFSQTIKVRGIACDARLANGILTITHYKRDLRDWRISTWDVERGNHLRMAHLPNFCHRDLRVSGDGTIVFEVDRSVIRAWCSSTGRSAGSISLESPENQFPLSLIVDGSVVWICLEEPPTKGWDLRNLESPPILYSDRHRLELTRADDTKRRNTGPTRIKDIVTGKEVFRLPERFAQPSVTQWDGRYLVAADKGTGEPVILDFAHMIPQ